MACLAVEVGHPRDDCLGHRRRGTGSGLLRLYLAAGNVALGGLWSLRDSVVRFWDRTLVDVSNSCVLTG